MKIIMIAADYHCSPIGSYTLEGFSKYLNYHINEVQADDDWLGRELLLFVMKCDANLNDMWGTEWGSNQCTARIMCIRNDDGKYLWYMRNQEYTCEELVKEIEQYMTNDDDKVKKLEAEIAAYQKRIEYLENHIKYMPDGEGAIEAQEHFVSLAESD